MIMLEWIYEIRMEQEINNIKIAPIVNEMSDDRLRWLGDVTRRDDSEAVRLVD